MIAGRKVILVVPGFASAEIFEASRAHIEPLLTPGLIDEKWLLLNKYPLPSVEENERDLITAAERFGYMTFDSGDDLGLAGSLDNFFIHNPQPPGTLLMSIDPDSTTDAPGFDLAMCEVILADVGLPACVLGIPHTVGAPASVVAGHRVYIHPSIMMTNIGCVDLDWHGVSFTPGAGRLWGGNESVLYDRLKATGTHLAYLLDYVNAPGFRSRHDIRYAIWKWEHFYGRFSGSFAEYLTSPKCVIDLVSLYNKQREVLAITEDLVASVENGTDLSGVTIRLRRELDGLGDY